MPNEKTLNIILVSLIVIGIGLFAWGIPIIRISYIEEYNETVESEYEVPVVTLEEKTETLYNQPYPRLNPDHYIHQEYTISEGEGIILEFESDISINAYIFTEEQFLFWSSIGGDTAEASTTDTSSILAAFCELSNKYYFVLYNPHGYSDWAGISQFEITKWHQEEVTEYRTETEYIVEIKFRTIKDKVTILEYLLS